jgi:hypothetical protein
MKRLLKSAIHKLFIIGQRGGFDILPRHYYSEIPDIGKLQRTDAWRKPYQMVEIAGSDCDEQVRFALNTIRADLDCSEVYSLACQENGAPGFGMIEAEFLYNYIAAHRPRSIIQIGAGVSTSIILQAAHAAAYAPTVSCIDPYPTPLLRRLEASNKIELLALPVEEVTSTIVSRLGKGDLFFVDSTHTLGPAGEVSRLILEWLPQLSPGVRVHFHDISFPYDYNPDVLQTALFFPHETALLYAFLCLNRSFRILCSLSILHHYCQASLMEMFPRYRPMQMKDGVMIKDGHFPSSIYIERTDA